MPNLANLTALTRLLEAAPQDSDHVQVLVHVSENIINEAKLLALPPSEKGRKSW